MDLFEFVQKFFLILLPGIVGSYIYAAINIRTEQHYYLEFLKIIVLSFVSYLLADLLLGTVKQLFPCFIYNTVDIIHHIGTQDTDIPTANVLVSTIFGIVVACLMTKANYENWIFKLANILHLTRRIDNQCVWEHVFDQDDIIVLRDRITNNTYCGIVKAFSDNSENREIYFEDVNVFDKYSEFLYHADKLYLSRAHNEFTIEVQKESVQEGDE